MEQEEKQENGKGQMAERLMQDGSEKERGVREGGRQEGAYQNGQI